MKRLISLFLVCALLAGCVPKTPASTEVTQPDTGFQALSDPRLLLHLEETVYTELVQTLQNDEYFVENVTAVYISKEYLEETAYNSQPNLYFGYTLAELDEAFQGTRYVFSPNDDGQITVRAFAAYDDTYDRVIRNVATGAGVILLCVTVSAVSGIAGASAVSLVFAVSAKAGTVAALSDGLISGVTAGVVEGIETEDFDAALKAAALSGSEGFQWGAMIGAVAGGVRGLAQIRALKGATLNGLTLNQAAKIQMESQYPVEIIKKMHSMEEYEVLKQAGLTARKVNGQWALVQEIDWTLTDSKGLTNLQRVLDRHLSPIGPDGQVYHLHHVGQMADSPLAILSTGDHQTWYSVLHANTGTSASAVNHGAAWQKIVDQFWTALALAAG